MAKLELTLFDKDGEATVFQANHVSGQKLLDYWNLMIDIEQNMDKYSIVEILTKKAEYVASLFSNKRVTAEAIINGVDSWNLIDVIDDLIKKAIGEEESDPKPNDLAQNLPETVISTLSES